jgi:ATP-dependent DNA ligase
MTDKPVFRHACALDVEGIVSKPKGAPKGAGYRSGRTLDWIKLKTRPRLAAKRDAEGFDWGR